MRAYRFLALIILIVVFFIGYTICGRGNSGDSADSGGLGFVKISEIKGELIKIRVELQELEQTQRDLAKERLERLRENESTEDLDQELKETREKIQALENREIELTDQLSATKK